MALPGGGWEGGARGRLGSAGVACQGEAREVTRGVGTNNLIEPIDARPVFTAFSATLPRSFYSNPRASARSFVHFALVFIRARAPDSSLSFPLSVPNGDKPGPARSLDTASPSVFSTRATPACISLVLDTDSPASFRGVAPTFLFLSADLLPLFLRLRAREKRRDRRFGGRSAECFRAA